MKLTIIILGILISIIYYEITDITPGGIVVPGLMVLYINEPLRMVYTVLIAIASVYLVKLLSKWLLLFGKRRFVLLILVSIILNFICSLIFKIPALSFLNVTLVGYTVSGLIANNIYKQGLKRTIPSLAIVICALELIVILSKVIG